MSAYIDLVKKLQGLAERRDRAAILAMVTPDLEYHYHVGSKPVTGPEGLGRFLDNYWGRSKDGVWKIETFAQSGDGTAALSSTIRGFFPSLASRDGSPGWTGALYNRVQSRIHVVVSRRYFARLIAETRR